MVTILGAAVSLLPLPIAPLSLHSSALALIGGNAIQGG